MKTIVCVSCSQEFKFYGKNAELVDPPYICDSCFFDNENNKSKYEAESQLKNYCDCPISGFTIFHKKGCINYE